MTEGKLVFVLPKEKRPNANTFYGRSPGTSRPPGPICMVKPNGEVRMFDPATILEVRAVLACFPYYVEFEDLRGVYIRDEA